MKSLLFVLLCAAAALAPLVSPQRAAPSNTAFPGWPSNFEQAALRQLPLSPIEDKFQENFPGRVGRFTDGQREIIVRWVSGATRKLHPGSDGFKANGYTLTPRPIATNGAERWSVFIASKDGQALEVRERIVDSTGAQWSDVSAWYWAVQLGQTTGQWWAVTVARTAR